MSITYHAPNCIQDAGGKGQILGLTAHHPVARNTHVKSHIKHHGHYSRSLGWRQELLMVIIQQRPEQKIEIIRTLVEVC